MVGEVARQPGPVTGATSSEASGAPDLQVLICTHNRAELLSRTIASLNTCHRPTDSHVELYVVANACTDGTAEFLDDYMDRADNDGLLPLRWSAESTPGKSHALNHAAPRLTAPAIAFVDDDHRVDADYLTAVCIALATYPDVELFCGRILPDWDGSEPVWVHDNGPYRIYPLPVPRFDLGPKPKAIAPNEATPGGGNLFLRRELLYQVGPFAVDFGPHGHDLGGAEDIEWVRRARAMGARLQYCPSVIQYHYVDAERLCLRYLVRKAYQRSASISRLSEVSDGNWRVPRYMYRKVLTHLLLSLIQISSRKRRFYLVRLAAAMGEMKGFLMTRPPPPQQQVAPPGAKRQRAREDVADNEER